MFKIRIWYEINTVHKNFPYDMGINFIKCDKDVGFTLENQPVEYVITVFVANVVFQNVGLYWIIK